VLLALTIISTVAAVSGALSALGLLPERRPRPQIVVIVVTRIDALAVEPQPESLGESDSEPGKRFLVPKSTGIQKRAGQQHDDGH
jgi:hypothetical protein